MQFEEYRERLKARLFSNFDFEDNVMVGSTMVDTKASFKRTTERYVLLKKNVQYRYDTYEYFYLIRLSAPSREQIERLMTELTETIVERTLPDQDHMSSDHTIICHVDSIQPETADYVRRFIYRKMFKLGFKGWIHIGLVMVDTTGQIIYSRHRKQKPYRFLDIKS